MLRVLTVYGPGRYYLDDGPQGLTVEYARALETFINKRFDTGDLRIHVVCIPVARDELFPELESGGGDLIIAGTTITAARAAEVDFTMPESKPLREVLVTGPAAAQLDSIDDLAGQRIYLRRSSSYADSVAALNRDFKARGLRRLRIQPVDEALEDEDIIEMVNAGLLPWAIVDSYKPQMWREVFTELTVRDDIVFREGARLAWAIRHDSPQLKALLNDFLSTHREGTLFGNVVHNRYHRDFDWASNALAAAELARYRDLKDYFATYGERYQIDPSLLAAQGYQESRLDQSVRSPAGAIGVMQLLPSTAADKNVNIPDIHRVEPNIQAGAKYLAFLRGRYFDDPALDRLNAALLALAAYNAGPARVRELRDIATQRGYDPNRWFDHVEVIAAEKIGRETVQYVANIFKYYLSYRWIDEQAQERDAARRAAGVPDKPA